MGQIKWRMAFHKYKRGKGGMKKLNTVMIILATALVALVLCSCQPKRETVENLQGKM